jgi:hypothetical protein
VDEKIFIDGEVFYKSQYDKISKKVLQKCNFINKKSNNNNKSLKAGTGKLMFTNGMSLDEFSTKYKLPK